MLEKSSLLMDPNGRPSFIFKQYFSNTMLKWQSMSGFAMTGIYFMNTGIFKEMYFIPAKVPVTVAVTT